MSQTTHADLTMSWGVPRMARTCVCMSTGVARQSESCRPVGRLGAGGKWKKSTKERIL